MLQKTCFTMLYIFGNVLFSQVCHRQPAQRRSKLLKSPRNLPCNSVESFSTPLGTAWDMGISDLILNSESCLVVSNIFIVNHSGISWAVDPELVQDILQTSWGEVGGQESACLNLRFKIIECHPFCNVLHGKEGRQDPPKAHRMMVFRCLSYCTTAQDLGKLWALVVTKLRTAATFNPVLGVQSSQGIFHHSQPLPSGKLTQLWKITIFNG